MLRLLMICCIFALVRADSIFLDSASVESKDDKVIIIVFGKEDCYHCSILESSMSANDTIAGYISLNFSPYYIDISDKKRHSIPYLNILGLGSVGVARLYNIDALPTIIFVSGKDEIMRIVGFPGEKRLINLLEFINNNSWKNYDNPKDRVKAFLEQEKDSK